MYASIQGVSLVVYTSRVSMSCQLLECSILVFPGGSTYQCKLSLYQTLKSISRKDEFVPALDKKESEAVKLMRVFVQSVALCCVTCCCLDQCESVLPQEDPV